MDEWALLVLVVLAFPVMALVGFVMAIGQRSRIRLLEAKVAALEAVAARAGFAPPDTAPLTPQAPQAGQAPQAPQTPQAPQAPLVPEPPETDGPAVPVPPQAPAPAPPGRAPEPPPWPFGRTRAPWQHAPAPAGSGAAGEPPAAPAGGDGGSVWGARPPAAPPPPLKERLAGFEEKVGARWAVWVGGLALALGGVFLVRFAVEQDLIGPAARVGLGLLLAALLLAGGEWLRRRERTEGFAGVPAAHVPSVLTAAGTMTAFGSIYAAYELYHLISPQVAFLLLAATGVATLLAALLHGPALAALGFVGAAVTPFLISTDAPNAWGVALLIAAVAASALGVARVRRWAWLALLATAGVVAWGLTLLAFDVPQAVNASGVLGLVLLALTAALLAPGLLWGPPGDGRADAVSSLAAAGALAVTAAAAASGEVAAGPLALFVGASLALVALAWRARALTFATLAVALLAPVLLLAWVFPPDPGSAVAPPGPVAGAVPEAARLPLGHFLAYGFGMGALMLLAGIAGAARAGRAKVRLGWALTGAVGPVLLTIAAYGRLTDLDRSLPFAALALALAFAFTLAAERLSRSERSHGATVFAAGAVTALALALTFALEKGWLTVSLALAACGVAWISTLRPLPGLRQFSAGLALVVLGRVIWLPTIAGVDPGSTPIFNWLLWGYGVPAASFAGAAMLLAKGGDDWSRRVHECLALVFAVLLATLQVRHLAHGGDIYAQSTRLFETGLLASIYGAYAVGLARLAQVTGRWLYRLFSYGVAALAAVCALNGIVEHNPFATGESVGGPVFNDLMVAYAIPAILALAFAALQPVERVRLRLAARAVAVVLALAYVTLEVSRLFQGPVLDADSISSAEWYAYSAAWLVFGMVLLGIGLWRGSRTLRLASAAVMVATVLKVFLSDMADLEGVLRALSFIGLGLVLVAMGWVYQRLLARGAAARPEQAGSPGQEAKPE